MPSVQRKLGMNLIWNTLNTWGVSALSVTSTIVYARLLQPDQWGVYSTFTWLVTSFALLITIGWNLTINKFVAEAMGKNQPQRAAGIFRFIITIEVIGAIAMGMVITVGTPKITAVLGRPELARAMPFIAIGMGSMVLFTTCNMGLIALQQYRMMSFVTVITSSLALAGGTTWLLHGGGPRGLITIVAAANTTNALISLALISRSLPIWSLGIMDRHLLSAMARYCFSGTLIVILMQIVYERAEVFFLSRSQSPAQIGYYSLAVAMTNIVIVSIPNVVIGPLLAMTAELHGRDDRKGLRELFQVATRLLVLIAPPVAVGGAIVARPLLALMYGADSRPVGIAAMLLLPPAALMVVAKPATSLLWGMGKQGLLLRPLAFGAVLNLSLDAIIIPRYGLYGAILSSGFAQVVTTVLTTRVCLNFLRYAFPWRPLIRTATAALVMIPFAALAAIWLDGIVLLFVDVCIGAVTYPVALFLLGAIDADILSTLTGWLHRLPRPLQLPCSTLLDMLADRV